MKATHWARTIGSRYRLVCHSLGLEPLSRHHLPHFESVSWKWVRNAYMDDFRKREVELMHELVLQEADDVLKLDWTKGSASRCGQPWLFNAMDGAGKVLSSIMTATASPSEVRPVLEELAARGCQPKVIYVDDECCGLWRQIVAKMWPLAEIRLDAFHAIRRLTSATASTRHPWHGRFCGLISRAMFVDEPGELARLKAACGRVGKRLSLKLKSAFVPKAIAPAKPMIERIGAIIDELKNQEHPRSGKLVTLNLLKNWDNLQDHINQGCLEDPCGVDLYEVDYSTETWIGNEAFYRIRCRRGTSALEGFHGKQKRWLGPARHSLDHGLALLADGTQRHNRKLQRVTCDKLVLAQNVFAAGLLSCTDDIYNADMRRSVPPLPPPVRSLARATPTISVCDSAGAGHVGLENGLRNENLIPSQQQRRQTQLHSQVTAADEAPSTDLRRTGVFVIWPLAVLEGSRFRHRR